MPGTKITTGVNKGYAAIYKEPSEGKPDGEWEAAFYLPGLRQMTITANQNSAVIYAENRQWDSENALGDIDVSFDFVSIMTEHYAKLLGKKLAANGGIIENANDEPPYIAIMGEKTLTSGVIEYITLFKGKLNIPEDTAKTKEGNTEYQTKTLTGKFMTLPSGIWKHFVRSDDEGFDAATHATNWGKTVVIPTEAPEPPTTPEE